MSKSVLPKALALPFSSGPYPLIVVSTAIRPGCVSHMIPSLFFLFCVRPSLSPSPLLFPPLLSLPTPPDRLHTKKSLESSIPGQIVKAPDKGRPWRYPRQVFFAGAVGRLMLCHALTIRSRLMSVDGKPVDSCAPFTSLHILRMNLYFE